MAVFYASAAESHTIQSNLFRGTTGTKSKSIVLNLLYIFYLLYTEFCLNNIDYLYF